MSLLDVVELTALLRQQVANRPLLLFLATLTLLALVQRRDARASAPSNAKVIAAAAAIGFLRLGGDLVRHAAGVR